MAAPPEIKTEEERLWHASFPAPRASVPGITGEELMKKFDDMDIEPKPRDFLLVDVRRMDWEGGTILSSLNLPAQSFYQSRKTLLDLCERAGIKQVVFYCGKFHGYSFRGTLDLSRGHRTDCSRKQFGKRAKMCWVDEGLC